MDNLISQQTDITLLHKARQDMDTKATAIDRAKQAKNIRQVEKSAREFEAVFISEMMKPMFEGIETDPMFGGGFAEETYKSLMLQEYGNVITEAGGIGIADHVVAELLRIQEEQQNNDK